MSPNLAVRTIVSLAALSLAQSAIAQLNIAGVPEARTGITGLKTNKTANCPVGEFISSISVRLTDRVTALWITCQKATFDGLWTADAPTSYPVAGDTEKRPFPLSCPPNYFITGLGYLDGRYSEDSRGLGKPVPFRLIADLRPVCRLQHGRPYILNRNYLDQAHDNDVKEIFWQDGNPRDCRKGYAAVAVGAAFQTQRDWQMRSRFHDVVLFCRRLPTGPIPGLDRVRL